MYRLIAVLCAFFSFFAHATNAPVYDTEAVYTTNTNTPDVNCPGGSRLFVRIRGTLDGAHVTLRSQNSSATMESMQNGLFMASPVDQEAHECPVDEVIDAAITNVGASTSITLGLFVRRSGT